MTTVEVVLPVLNEEKVLATSVHRLHAFLGENLPDSWQITIADNGSTDDLSAFPRLVAAIAEGRSDVAAGTRLGPGAETTRSLRRELLSRGFVFLINGLFRTRLRDTQCGFKAISRECARKLLPCVEDTGWFWDTELLLLAAKGGWAVEFVPVRWEEDTDSRVKLARTVWRDLKGLARMRRFDWAEAQKTVHPGRRDARARATVVVAGGLGAADNGGDHGE